MLELLTALALIAAPVPAQDAPVPPQQPAAEMATVPPALPGDRIIDPAPSADKLALGRALADSGTLAALAPLMTMQETEQLVADVPDLIPAERERLRAIAAATAAAGTERLLDALGRQYAMRLTAEEMRALTEFARTPAAQKMQAIMPFTIAGTVAALGEVDFKGEVLAAFCAETGKGCEE